MALSSVVYNEEIISLEDFNVKQNIVERRWQHLGDNTWLKFVIGLRDRLHQHNWKNCTFEFVFIDLLKTLTSKRVGKLLRYVSDVSSVTTENIEFIDIADVLKNQTRQNMTKFESIFKSLFGINFVNHTPAWLTQCYALHLDVCSSIAAILRTDDVELLFVFPDAWKKKMQTTWPFELFIRSRWGSRLLDILGCTREHIGWWSTPSDAISATSGSSTSVPTWLLPFTQAFVSVHIYSDKESEVFLAGDKSKLLLWDVLELSISPVWNRRFNAPDLLYLTKDPHNLAVCNWITHWIQTFHLPFMRSLNDLQQGFTTHGLDFIKHDITWTQQISKIKHLLYMNQTRPSAPRFSDMEDSVDFLLDPCLLMQLSWSAALQHQWLVVALLVITRFDVASMELRHWPLTMEYLPLANMLLKMVSLTRERILAALALLCLDIARLPMVNSTRCGNMFSAILPTLPVLKLLVNGEAYSFLKKIKQSLWSKPTPASNQLAVLDSSYKIQPELTQFMCNHFTHINYWMHHTLWPPFSSRASLTRLLSGIPPIEKGKQFVTSHSKFFEIKSMGPPNLDNKRTHSVLHGRNTEKRFLQTVADKYFTAECLPRIRDKIEQDLLGFEDATISMKQVQNLLCGLDQRHTALACLVRLTGESIVREQEVRIAAACARACHTTPTISDPSGQDSQSTRDDRMEMFAVCYSAVLEMNRVDVNWLESKLPVAEKPLDILSLIADQQLLTAKLLGYVGDTKHTERILEHCLSVLVRYMFMVNKIGAARSIGPFSTYYCWKARIATFLNIPTEGTSESVLIFKCRFLASCLDLLITAVDDYQKLKGDNNKCDIYPFKRYGVLQKKYFYAKLSSAKSKQDMLVQKYRFIGRYCKVETWVDAFLDSLIELPVHLEENGSDRLTEIELYSFENILLISDIVSYDMDIISCMVLLIPLSTDNHESSNYLSLGIYGDHLCHSQYMIAVLMNFMLMCGQIDENIRSKDKFRLLELVKHEMKSRFPKIFMHYLRKESHSILGSNNCVIETGVETQPEIHCESHAMLSQMLVLIKDVRRDVDADVIELLLELDPAVQFRRLVKQFLKEGSMAQIARKLGLKVPAPCGSQESMVEIRRLTVHFPNFEHDLQASVRKMVAIRKCRWCKAQEQPGRQPNFITCASCTEDSEFPDPHYFCSDRCNTKWARKNQKEHFANHLEFQLQLPPYDK